MKTIRCEEAAKAARKDFYRRASTAREVQFAIAKQSIKTADFFVQLPLISLVRLHLFAPFPFFLHAWTAERLFKVAGQLSFNRTWPNGTPAFYL